VDVRFGSHSGLKSDIATCPKTCTNPEVAYQKKNRPKAALNFNLMMVDQAAINAGFNFRRYAMKPIPAKPRSSIAQVEGSGTAVTCQVPSLLLVSRSPEPLAA
jgi:hypothetical protein